MNFHQLKYIIAIDRFRSFAKAADFCDIAQSTLSKEVQRLEKEYKVIIFDRSRHPVVPTLKGADMIAQAKKILQEQELFESIAKERNNKIEGEFKLGILPGLAPYLLPLFVEQLAKKYKDLKLYVDELDQKHMDEQLQAGQLDGCIIIHPFFREGYYETLLFDESFVLYVDAQSELLNKPVIKPEDIPFESLLLHEDIKRELLTGATYPPGKKLARKLNNVTYKRGSLETIRKIIDLNGGVTLLPETACIYMGERRKQLTIPIQSAIFSRTVSFIAPRGFQKNRLIKIIIREIFSHLPDKLKKYH